MKLMEIFRKGPSPEVPEPIPEVPDMPGIGIYKLVLDWRTARFRKTNHDNHRSPRGIDWVLVKGWVAIPDGELPKIKRRRKRRKNGRARHGYQREKQRLYQEIVG